MQWTGLETNGHPVILEQRQTSIMTSAFEDWGELP